MEFTCGSWKIVENFKKVLSGGLVTADGKARTMWVRENSLNIANGTHFDGHQSFSVELFKVKKYLNTRIVLKIFESDSVTLGHGKIHGKSWILKSLKGY